MRKGLFWLSGKQWTRIARHLPTNLNSHSWQPFGVGVGTHGLVYGGEEFAMILPNAPMAIARMTAERVRNSIATRDVKKRTTGESLGQITISIGVAEFRPGESSVEFVERADSCLYAAKRAGRNRVVGDSDPETASEEA